jgi:lipopolysaccharide heptosyltransferase II
VSAGPRNVAILRFSALGDVVLTSPAVQALAEAWPDAEITFVTKERFAPLVAHNPHIAHVLTLGEGESLLTLRQRLAERQPDVVLDLHDNLRASWLRRLAPAKRKVVWRKRPFWHGVAVRLRLTTYSARLHIAARYHAAVEQLVGHQLPPGDMKLWVDGAEAVAARDTLVTAGVDLERPVVGMAPGSMWETKRWPTDRWGQLASRCIEAGWQVVLTGSPAEREVTAAVREHATGAVDLAGQVSIGQLGAVVANCSAFVANDSGPMHVARALGVPTLAFFGSTDPAQFDFTGHGLMWAALECAPCSLYGLSSCPRRHFRCMLDLGVDAAWAELEALVTTGARPTVRG